MNDEGKKRRSPSFPFISLKKAVERMEEFGEHYQPHHRARIKNLAEVWEYAEKSSGLLQTISALTSYGLLESEGQGEERRIKMSDESVVILKDAREGAKDAAIHRAALRPEWFNHFWEEWGDKRPPDNECVSILTIDHNFTDSAAKTFLRVYDETIEFADLERQERAVKDDQHANENQESKGQEAASRVQHQLRKDGNIAMTTDACSLEGVVATLEWPEKLTESSLEDFKDWLDLLKKKAERRVADESETQDTSGA